MNSSSPRLILGDDELLATPDLTFPISQCQSGEAQRVIGLGGKEYLAMIKEASALLGCPLRSPFAGLPIGKMTQATNRAIESGKFTG